MNKVDTTTEGPVSATEADLENHSTTPEVTTAQTNDLVTQFKTDTVSLCSDTLYMLLNFDYDSFVCVVPLHEVNYNFHLFFTGIKRKADY